MEGGKELYGSQATVRVEVGRVLKAGQGTRQKNVKTRRLSLIAKNFKG